jgi:hypothetical protein
MQGAVTHNGVNGFVFQRDGGHICDTQTALRLEPLFAEQKHVVTDVE